MLAASTALDTKTNTYVKTSSANYKHEEAYVNIMSSIVHVYVTDI